MVFHVVTHKRHRFAQHSPYSTACVWKNTRGDQNYLIKRTCGKNCANTMWRKLLYSGFETCFGPSTQGAGIRYQNTSQIQILRHFEKRGAWCKHAERTAQAVEQKSKRAKEANVPEAPQPWLDGVPKISNNRNMVQPFDADSTRVFHQISVMIRRVFHPAPSTQRCWWKHASN